MLEYFDIICKKHDITLYISYHDQQLYDAYRLINTNNIISINAHNIDIYNNVYAEYSVIRHVFKNDLCKTKWIMFSTYRRRFNMVLIENMTLDENKIYVIENEYVNNFYTEHENDYMGQPEWISCLYTNDFQQWLEQINYPLNFKTQTNIVWKEMFLCTTEHYKGIIEIAENLLQNYLIYKQDTIKNSAKYFNRWFIEHVVSLAINTYVKEKDLYIETIQPSLFLQTKH